MDSTQVCPHLRTKSMYIPALTQGGPEPETEPAGRSSHCWCNLTLTEVGPDDQPVKPQLCQAGRSCFDS